MYGIGGFGGMGGFGGGYGGNPQFQNAVGQHLGNMMGGQAAQGMGNQMGYAPSPGYNPQQGQMLMNPNYAQLGQGVSNQFGQYGQMGQQMAGHQMLMDTTMPVPPRPNQFMGSLPGSNVYADALRMRADRAREFGFGNGGMSQYPGFGGAVQPGGMDYLRGQFGGGYGGGSPWGAPVDNDSGYGRPTYGGAPQPGGGRVDNPYMQHQSRDGGLLYGGPPQPDTGAVDNPDQRHQFNNGDQYHNRKGNLRMRYRNMQPSYQ